MKDVTVFLENDETVIAPKGVCKESYFILLEDDRKECIPWHRIERVRGTLQ